MDVQIRWKPFNERRYRIPYISKMTFWSPSEQKVEWGNYIGDSNDGGLLVMPDCNEGDILHYGQKDNRGTGTINVYAIVNGEGELESVTRAKAFLHWEKNNKNWEANSDNADIKFFKDAMKIVEEEIEAMKANVFKRIKGLG